MSKETLLTTKQLAKRWGIHPQTLINNRSQKKGVKFVKRTSVVYALKDVIDYENKNLIFRK